MPAVSAVKTAKGKRRERACLLEDQVNSRLLEVRARLGLK